MKGTSCTTAGSYGEVLLASFNSFLLVGSCYRMLESGRIGRVTCDRYVYVLFPHDSNAFRYGICAIAVNLCTKALGISSSAYFLNFVGIRIILCLNKSKSVNSGNNLCSVFSKTVQNNSERFLTNLVCLLCNTDSAFSGCEGLMSCQETEAVGILFQKHLSKVSVSKTNLTGICYGTGNTEGLKSLTDCCCCFRCLSAVLLDCDCCAYCVCPASIFKADRLDALYKRIYIKSCILCNFLSFFQRSDSIAV